MKRNQHIFTSALLLVALALAGPAAWATTITRTYLFSGGTAGSNTTFQGYFYEEGIPDAHYICYPETWTYGTTSSIHATLANGITINIASSSNKIGVLNGLVVEGDVTVTVSGGSNYYIWRVALYHSSNEAAFNQTNWGANVESTHTFSKTISAGSFYKLAVTYSTDDIYLINDSSTTISGVENAYAYTGSPITPEPVVVCNGRTLTKENYSISYLYTIYPGTATLLITGKGLFHGSVSKDFDIVDPQLVWSAGSTVQLTENRITMNPILVAGTGNVTLGIADGVTLKAERGIIIDAGATLTMKGPGSLVVSNKKGEDGSRGDNGYDGSNGSNGRTAISGALIVNGGTVDVAGSSGGAGGEGGGNGSIEVKYRCGNAGSGADGGAGIDGSLIVYDGTVTIEGGTGGAGGAGGSSITYVGASGNGGNGGNGGLGITGSLTVYGGTVNATGGVGGVYGLGGKTSGGSQGGNPGKAGSDGRALGGVVTCTAPNYVIRECYNYEWTDLASGSTSSKRRIQVFERSTFTVTAHKGTFAGQTRYWATIYHPNSTFLLPAEAQAFRMGSKGSDYVLYRLFESSIIPSDCPVVIMVESSSTNDSIEITLTKTSPKQSEGGVLEGTSTPTDASSLVTGNKNVYVLSKGTDGNVGFFPFNGTIPANKAYYVR
jgi:hypothetical protein